MFIFFFSLRDPAALIEAAGEVNSMASYNKEEVLAFIDRLDKAITTNELRKHFPGLSRGSAYSFLRRKHRLILERWVLPYQKPVAATLDKSINYNDAERRAETRKRIRANHG